MDLLLRPVTSEDTTLLRRMADSYWDELMPTASTVRTEEARSEYYRDRFGDGKSQTMSLN